MVKNNLQFIYMLVLSFCLVACQTAGSKNKMDPEGYIASADGVQIHYEIKGNAQTTLVFVHCWSCNSTYWLPQINHFTKKYQTVTLDLAGHGKSAADRVNYTMEKFAEDVAAVVKGLELTHVILIGHSMGGPIVIAAAPKLPDRVIGLVAVDSFNTGYPWPEEQEIAETLTPFQKNFYQSTYAMVKTMFAPHTPKAIIYRISKDLALAPPDIGLSSMENLLLWMAAQSKNDKDNLSVPLIHINAAQNTKPDTVETIIPVQSTGHFIPQEAPEKFNKALEMAIEQIVNSP